MRKRNPQANRYRVGVTEGPLPSETDSVRRDRMAGWAMIGVGVVALVAAAIGAAASLRFVSVLSDQAETTLEVTEQAVTAIEETIALADATHPQVEAALATLVEGVADVGPALDNVVTLMNEAAGLTGEDLNASIGAIRETMPGLIASARLLSATLNALSFLGVEYDPEPTLEESMTQIDESLATMEARLGEASGLIEETAASIAGFTGTFDAATRDLAALQTSFTEVGILLDDYAATAADASAAIAEARSGLDQQTHQLRFLILLIAIAVVLAQFTPLYLGWRLVAGTTTSGQRRPTAIRP